MEDLVFSFLFYFVLAAAAAAAAVVVVVVVTHTHGDTNAHAQNEGNSINLFPKMHTHTPAVRCTREYFQFHDEPVSVRFNFDFNFFFSFFLLFTLALFRRSEISPEITSWINLVFCSLLYLFD